MPLDRRHYLHLVVAGGLTVAGCLTDGDQGATPTPDGSPTTEQRPTEAGGGDSGPTTATADGPTTDGSTTSTPTLEQTPLSETTSDRTTQPTTTVDMVNTTFDPVRVSVDPGTRVRWVNRDSLPHTVTSAQFHDVATSWSFDERAEGGHRLTHTFEQAGVCEYYCTIHGREQMCGVVLVGEVSLDQSLPCESGNGTGGY